MVDEVQSIDHSRDIFEVLGPNELWEYIQLHDIQFQYSKSKGDILKLEVMSYWRDILHQISGDASMDLRGILLNYYTIKNRKSLTPSSQNIQIRIEKV